MPVLKQFSTPARQNDFPNNPNEWAQMQELWSTNVDGFTQQCILGDPWNMQYESFQNWYYNPLVTNMPADAPVRAITWLAFPNRLIQYYGQNQVPENPYNFPIQQLWEMADYGRQGPSGATFPQIPSNRCSPTGATAGCPQVNWNTAKQPYGPYGPRGWLDEYCEFSVTRRTSDNKITRVDFCCENPEYWQTLWRVRPDTAAQVYQDTLNYGLATGVPQITVTVDDLTLYDPNTGAPVIDPSTGKPAYNPLNKWNSGPLASRIAAGQSTDSGGAMHLTATPNTLQTELGLAGGATVQRTEGNAYPQCLICCSQYGQNYRNSDPHIGQSVNQVVTPGNVVTLADPPGLYIQQPTSADFTTYFKLPSDPNLPANATAEDCWQVVRGTTSLNDEFTNQPYPGNFILHVAFQIPSSWIEAGVSFTVGDIEILASDGNWYPINYASQILQQFHIGLFAWAFPPGPSAGPSGATYYGPTGLSGLPPKYPCVTGATASVSAPVQAVYQDLWNAYYNTNVPNPAGFTMNLASNSSIIAPIIEPGASGYIALTANLGNPGATTLPNVTFPNGGVTAKVLGVTGIFYAPPGNSYPSSAQLLSLFVNVDADAPTGLQPLVITQGNENPNSIPPGRAFLNIVSPSGMTGVV